MLEWKMAETLTSPYPYVERLTRAGLVLLRQLEEDGRPIITQYELFRKIRTLYITPQNFPLRQPPSLIEGYHRMRRNLLKGNAIAPDPDYSHRAYRVPKNPDLSADEICCIVDSFCYISHLSAMQRYGLTNKRPEALQISRPGLKVLRGLAQEKMRSDYSQELPLRSSEFLTLKAIAHPHRVRGRTISLFQTVHPGKSMEVSGTYSRVATIGQIFVDSLGEPSLHGGMAHVLDVWANHARTYFEEIIQSVEDWDMPIVKVRAGYLLEERLHIKDSRIENWRQYAQRGGSRVLDPTKPYASVYSEKWMISINV